MSSITASKQTISVGPAGMGRSLRNLYFLRFGFSVTWIILLSVSLKANPAIAEILFVIYPLWDVVATFLDIRANAGTGSKTPQYVNIGIGILTTIGVAVALQYGVPEAIIVFGIWAFVTGLIQLLLGLRRRVALGGQWPMILSGGQSMLAGVVFILMAHAPSQGIKSLAGYSAFGAFYYLISAIRLSKKVSTFAHE